MQSSGNIGTLLQHTASLLARQSDQVLQEQLGIGMSQFKILRSLQTNPHIQQRQIANLLGQTEASISRQIKLLHDKHMIETAVNPQNRREHLTTLTAKGAKVVSAAMEVLQKYHAPTFNALSAKQHDEFIELLNTVHRQVCPLQDDGLAHPG